MSKSILSVWLRQIRAPFLLLSFFLVFIGVSKAYVDGYFNWLKAISVLLGVVLTHISVNLFNELSDYKTEIDNNTKRTPFSGGSGMMQEGKTNPKIVNIVAYLSMFVAGIIGFYFAFTVNYYILLLMIIGGISIRFYTSHLSRYLLGEIFSGLSLGSLVVIGTYLVLTGFVNFEIVYLSIPVGILTFLLLLLNEIPDVEADKSGGRKHLVVVFGKKKAFYIYLLFGILTFVLIFSYPFIFNKSFSLYLSLLGFVLLITIFIKGKNSLEEVNLLVPILGMNVLFVLLTDFLIGIGIILSNILKI